MDAKGMKAGVDVREAMVDFVELVAKALLSGIGVAIVMAVAILALTGGAAAAGMATAPTAAKAATVGINDAKTGTLLFKTAEAGRYGEAPKVSTEVAIEVHGMVARTAVTQVFHNPGADNVEGVYVFPLPEKAAVDRLTMRVGDRVLEGQVQEKEEARRTYEKAKAEGRKAALMEQQRPNLFTNAVAHIGAGEYVVIRIEYQQSLAYESGRYALRFPMAVTPRYTPAQAALPDEPKDAEAIATAASSTTAAPAAADEPILDAPQEGCGDGLVNPVDIAVSIDAGVPVGHVESSYHEVQVEKQAGSRVMVALAREQEEMDRDFELSWTVAGAAPQAAMFVQRKDGADYALLMVVPPTPDAQETAQFQRTPRETILIVDTSGSMQGTSIAQAKLAVTQALDSLTPRDRFNVIEFNSETFALYPQTMPATADNIASARAWVAKLQARGGTEMVPALTMALSAPELPGYLRQVVFMTDGGVANEEALFRLITQRLGNARLFTVGIGSAPNAHFMTKAAQFGRGTFTYIGDVREVQEKMSALFTKIEAPVLRDVSIRWADGSAVETFPARVPDLYLGEPVLVSAAMKGAGTVIVSGMRGNQPWSVALTPDATDAAGVGALWARAKIASLMDGLARGEDAAKVRADVVQVALEHHLVSAYTSLVAVDVTPTATGEAKRALVSTARPQGWAPETLPQTDTPAALQFLMGLAALLMAVMLAAAAKRVAPPQRIATGAA